MKLSIQDTALFFKLMWELQFDVNLRKRILSGVDSPEAFSKLSTEEKLRVRDILWDNPALIDAYVSENPQGLPADELEIVASWKQFVLGTFHIFRYLKKHTIFILDDDHVYGVLGLVDSIEDMLNGRTPPIMVNAVLLPFKGQIVHDGLISSYGIYFGGGIRSGLNEIYMAARQNGRIITTLELESAQPARQRRIKPVKDWGPVVDELVETASTMKGGPPVQSSAFGLLRASAQLAQAAVHDPENQDTLWDLERRVRTALSRVQTVLERAER